jgi:N-acetylglutamate synthase-like GNAT family acetyltransferase
MTSKADLPDDVIIRPATVADASAIRTIIRAARLNPFGLDWQRFLVAEGDGRVIGTGQVKSHSDGSREMSSIAVIPERHGQGIASAIIKALLARETGTLYLMCQSSLEPFYAAFGFRRIEWPEFPRSLRPFARILWLLYPLTFLIERGGGRLCVMRRDPG